MDIDYNKLKNFLAVIHSGSVTAAAKGLNRTQSAVSQSIRGLEQNLGLKLIEWEGKRLKLTREGQQVYKAIHAGMSAIEEQLNTILTAGSEVGGCIEIGVLQDHSTKIQEKLLDTLSSFRKKYPSVTFRIRFATSAEIEHGLLDQTLDMGFLINFKERYRFHVFEVLTEEHLVVTSMDYLKRVGPLSNLQDVIASDLIDIDESFTCFTPWVQKHSPTLVQTLEEKSPTLVASDFRVIRELVLLGQGISVVPKYLVESDLAKGTLVQVLPKLSVLEVGVDCAIIRGRKERLCERFFLEALRG